MISGMTTMTMCPATAYLLSILLFGFLSAGEINLETLDFWSLQAPTPTCPRGYNRLAENQENNAAGVGSHDARAQIQCDPLDLTLSLRPFQPDPQEGSSHSSRSVFGEPRQETSRSCIKSPIGEPAKFPSQTLGAVSSRAVDITSSRHSSYSREIEPELISELKTDSASLRVKPRTESQPQRKRPFNNTSSSSGAVQESNRRSKMVISSVRPLHSRLPVKTKRIQEWDTGSLSTSCVPATPTNTNQSKALGEPTKLQMDPRTATDHLKELYPEEAHFKESFDGKNYRLTFEMQWANESNNFMCQVYARLLRSLYKITLRESEIKPVQEEMLPENKSQYLYQKALRMGQKQLQNLGYPTSFDATEVTKQDFDRVKKSWSNEYPYQTTAYNLVKMILPRLIPILISDIRVLLCTFPMVCKNHNKTVRQFQVQAYDFYKEIWLKLKSMFQKRGLEDSTLTQKKAFEFMNTISPNFFHYKSFLVGNPSKECAYTLLMSNCKYFLSLWIHSQLPELAQDCVRQKGGLKSHFGMILNVVLYHMRDEDT